MNSDGGSSAITEAHRTRQHTVASNNKQGSANSVSPYFNTTTANSPPKKNAAAKRRKDITVSTTPNQSPSRQQLVKKSCHRHVSTQSKYFKKKMASSNNTPPPVALKDDTDKSIVVHDSSSLLSSVSHINQPHHTTSKICTYDVGGIQTTMKSSPVSTPDRKPFGDIGNSPTKLRNSATRSTTKSVLSQQSPPFIALQPFGTTKTFKPPLLLKEEDANHTTLSNVNATDADTLPATLPVAAPTRIRKPRPRHEIEATLKKIGRDSDSEKSMRRLKSAIMISERNSGARLPDDMNCILYQSKPSNVNRERVIRARRFYSYFEYSIGSDNDDDRKVFYRGSISAIDAANAFSALGFSASHSSIRNKAGKNDNEPSLLGDLISVKEVIECIFDKELGFVGTNEREVEASKDMIRQVCQQKKKEREEKQKQDNDRFGTVSRTAAENAVNAYLLAEKKELADLKEKASLAYHKYVELGSDINLLGRAELEALVKYICKVDKDTLSQHCKNMKKMKKRLGKCVPSWTRYFIMQFAVATHSFQPNESESGILSFQTGDVIMLNLSLTGNGWMMGCKHGKEEPGWCPLSVLKKFDTLSDAKLYAETLTKNDTLPEPLRSS